MLSASALLQLPTVCKFLKRHSVYNWTNSSTALLVMRVFGRKLHMAISPVFCWIMLFIASSARCSMWVSRRPAPVGRPCIVDLVRCKSQHLLLSLSLSRSRRRSGPGRCAGLLSTCLQEPDSPHSPGPARDHQRHRQITRYHV